MNGFEEIQKIVKSFIEESKQSKKYIAKIEGKRAELAQERNEKKKANINNYVAEVSVLGKQISELGNQSQELQNKLDNRFNEVKKLVNLTVDNFITEGIRKVRKIDEERQELEEKISLQEERNAKYEMQKQEFYERFGRIPEVSENAKKEDKIQDRQCLAYRARIEEIEEIVDNEEIELIELAGIKRDFKNGNWSKIIDCEDVEENVQQSEEEATILPLIEEIQIEEIEPIEEIRIDEFEPIQTIEVEDFEPIEELQIEEINVEKFESIDEVNIEELAKELFETEDDTEISSQKIEEVQEENQIDEIERIARAIVEEIAAEQTKEVNIDKVEEQEIITFEENQNETEKEENVTVPAFEENVTLSDIIAKIESGKVVYKAQVSKGEEIKIYPTQMDIGNILLNDKEIREEIKEILINYAITEHKILDKKVVKKIDPTVCQVLNMFAEKYDYNARTLIYNYAMSFSRNEQIEVNDIVPITYNFSYIKSANLNKKEKETISKICKNAINNAEINVIGCVTHFNKIKYIFKRLFATNKVNALPEGKY